MSRWTLPPQKNYTQRKERLGFNQLPFVGFLRILHGPSKNNIYPTANWHMENPPNIQIISHENDSFPYQWGSLVPPQGRAPFPRHLRQDFAPGEPPENDSRGEKRSLVYSRSPNEKIEKWFSTSCQWDFTLSSVRRWPTKKVGSWPIQDHFRNHESPQERS